MTNATIIAAAAPTYSVEWMGSCEDMGHGIFDAPTGIEYRGTDKRAAWVAFKNLVATNPGLVVEVHINGEVVHGS